LKHEITLEKGVVQQTNFNNFPVVRMRDAPRIDIVLVPSTEKPGGTGEPATALVVPAIVNAVAAVATKPVRKLPLTAQALRTA
jgi:isoquinoline 1-oxidoreductase beta subunit